ncbi:MAG: GNAT family N-acetyltransferase [Pseudomonadales bacterium]|nr:GNAT family N-acetyltransferase [Pseudomonadales bacterium]
MIIRQATIKDIAAIAQFNQAMALETEQKNLPDKKIIAGISTLVSNSKYGFYLVAEADVAEANIAKAKNVLLGCLGITYEWSDWRNGVFWWIQSVYIQPAMRRQGIFSKLYQHVKTLAKTESNVCGLRLYVEHNNHKAESTYLSLGMIETHYRLMEEEFLSD